MFKHFRADNQVIEISLDQIPIAEVCHIKLCETTNFLRDISCNIDNPLLNIDPVNFVTLLR